MTASDFGLSPVSQGSRVVDVVVRALAGAIGACATVLWALGMFAVIDSVFLNPQGDYHGFGRIFGVMFLVPCGLVAAATLPLTVPPPRSAARVCDRLRDVPGDHGQPCLALWLA